MLIINIKSIDPVGWETEREIELEDNDKLLQSLLRIVKRYTDPPKQKHAASDPAPDSDPEPEDEAPKPVPVRIGYRGFILAECKGCGLTFGFNAKNPVMAAHCKTCKTDTPLEEMVEAVFHCRTCKKSWIYQTNSQAGSVDTICIQCGDSLTAWWDRNKRRYETK